MAAVGVVESPELVKRFVEKKFSCGFGVPVCACVAVRDGLMAWGRSVESGVYRSADGRKFDAS